MEKLSPVLAKGAGRLWYWCPACNQVHAVNIDGDNAPRWTWNGSADRPTINPSVLNFTTHDQDGEVLPPGTRRTLCHHFVRDGQIDYCSDNPHALNGKSVPLPPLPDWVTS